MKIKNIKEYRLVTPSSDRITRAVDSPDNKASERFIEGYAAVFNQPSKLLIEFDGGELREFYEVLDSSCFNNVLASPDLDCIYNVDHDNQRMIARTKSGTLTLSVDDYGLKFRALIPNTTAGNDLYENVMLGNITENSFCFTVLEEDEEYNYDADGTVTRTIKNVYGLYDVSSVLVPAYNGTTLSLRGQKELRKQEEQPVLLVETEIVKAEEPTISVNDLIDLEIFLLTANSN